MNSEQAKSDERADADEPPTSCALVLQNVATVRSSVHAFDLAFDLIRKEDRREI